ncbi:MAG: helix-turn-helix domain-containing protein [Porphyromonadaceae bacterium]|nr:helix-turn-helix domain-containing protein [Porphyromonadaceae bacterium]
MEKNTDNDIERQRKELGTLLRSVRQSRKMTKSDLMIQARFPSYRYIYAVEDGRSCYTVDTLLQYASALGLSIMPVEQRNNH